ncbi:MAG: ParB N-terminal domain-containing protein [Muribaculaceae bacterium]|nr:ParB N-terminal domain-containing protein [Muribaculaceae bacterium]
MADYSWFNKRYLRSIDQLRPWSGNPRLSPEEQHVNLRDFVEDIIQEDGGKKSFMDLIRSIATNGFIPADPIVVWQDDINNRFYVAEGNRRVLALKLLRDPMKAPREIRGTVTRLANEWERIDKIAVNIAPSFEDAEWYISQRNSTSSIQQKWSRLQQMRWIESLYEKYADSQDILEQKSSMSLSEIEQIIRYIRLLNLVEEEQVKSALTDAEYRAATSHTFPITIFERFFNLTKVREAWGFEFDGTKISFTNKTGFLTAFTEVIRRIVSNKPDYKLDTRNVSSDKIDDLLEKLPKVDVEISDPYEVGAKTETEQEAIEQSRNSAPKPKPRSLKGDLNRNKLILGCYNLNTTEARLSQLFGELKRLSVNRYTSVCAAAVRIFLELAILDYIQSEGLDAQMRRDFRNDFKKIILKSRLDYLSRKSRLKSNPKVCKILKDLINEKETCTLDILNGYVHSKNTEYLNKQYLNGFWDHIFPLLQAILDITEDPEE